MTTPLPSFDAFAAELKKQGASEADAAILYMMQGGGAAYDAPAQAEEPGFVSDTGTALKSGWFETGAAMRGIGRALLPQSVFDAIDSLDGAGTPEERDLRWQARAAEITSEFSPEAQAAREKKWVRTDEEIEAGVGSAWLDPRSYWIGLMESIPGTAVTMGPTGFIARRAAQSAATKFLAGAEGRAITAQAGADAAMEAAKVAGGKAAQKTAIIAGGILEGAQGGGSAAEEVRAEIARMTPMQLQASDAYRALIEQGMSPEEAQASLKNDVGTQVFWAAGIATGIFGGRGDAMLQKAIGGTLAKSFTGRVARGAIEEGLLEEAPQGFFSTVGTNIAMQKVDPTRDPMEGALNQAAGGAVIGGLMGGGMAAALGRNRPEPNIDPAPPKLDGLTPDVAGEQLKAWSAEKTANVQAEMSRILQQRAAANDLASTQQEADLLAKMAQGRGMAATVEPVNVAAPAGFEAFTKDGNVSLGTYPDETSARRAFSGDERVDFRPLPAEGMTPGFFVNRQQVPGSETQEAPSFEYPTEEAARKLDPDGTRREIILSPGGFSSRAVDTARQAENIAALTRTAREENTNYLKEQAESIKDPVLKAEVLARAEEMAKTELRPAKDQPAAAYTRAYAETVGTEVQFVDIVSGPKFNGRVISVNGRRVLYINAASTVPHLQVTAHEVVHRMKTQYADLYDQAARELLPLWRPEARALMTARYRRNALSADGITEEMMGDFFATMSTDPQAMKALAKKNPTVWGKVATRIVEILDSILDLIVSGKKVPINSQLVKDLRKARAIYVDTMSEMGMRVRAEREQLTVNAAAEAQEMAAGRQPATDGIAQPQPGTTEDGLPMMAQSEHHAARQPRDADGKFVEGPPADSLPDTTDEDYRADVAATSENRDALAGPAPEVVSGFAARSDFTEDGVENLTGRDRWMVVTAEDPGAKKATKKYNRQAMADLRAYLDERDIEHFPVTGKYGDVQNSIVVIGDKATIALAERLRKKFGQESVLIPEGLLYEKGMVHPADGTSRTDPNVDDFYTELPDGSRWQYGIIFDEKIALDKAIELRKGNALNKVPAARRAAEGLTATEKSDLTPATARKFAEVFSKLPPVDEIAAVAYAGKAKRGWYRRSAQAIAELFGPDGPRFAMLLAAMSPQTSVEANLLNALNTWKNWVADGRPTDEASIMKLLGRSVMQADLNERPLALLRRMAGKLNMPELSTKEELVAQFESAMARSERMAARIKELSVLDAWVNNTVRALSTEFPGKVKLSGPKVTSFYLNLLDNVEEVTNDAWMATFSYVEQALFNGIARKDETGQSVGQKSGGYLAMSSKVRSAARRLTELTGDTWTPAEVQETVWSWTKAIYELRGKKGEKRSTIELLMDGEVTDKLIGSVPDFNDLFNETTYLGILHEAGYKPESLSLRSRGGERARAERGTAGKAAAPFEGVEQAALEFAVAGRLERRFNSIGDPGQLDSGPAEPAVRPGREGSVSGVGVHFGQSGDVPVLSGAAFGRGIKGKEKERVLRSTDPRIKRRIYFYIAAPGQQFDVRRREAGLGTHVYRAELGNLYESGKSPKLEFERAYINEEFKILDNEENLTRTEIAILDAGYDGYVVRNPDIAVVLNKDVRVRYLGQLGQGRFDIPGEAPLEATFAEDMEAQSREIERAAKEAGFASPDEMLRNAPESFFALAEKWRDENPRTPDVVDGAGMMDSMPPPKKTVKAYKLFQTKKTRGRNNLYPLFIGASVATPQGQWVVAENIRTKGFAERPGWHAGVEPIAPHLRGKKGKAANRIRPGRVWAEVELPADVDWQAAADNSPTRDIRGKIPARGVYRFRTNKMHGGAWLIGGGIKVNRILANEEVASILRKGGHSEAEIDREMQDMSTVNADVGPGLLESPEFVRWAGDAPVVRAADALDYDFQTGKPVVVEAYHGTNVEEDFPQFDLERGGEMTAAESAGVGVFATSSTEVAGNYARNIGMGRYIGLSLGRTEQYEGDPEYQRVKREAQDAIDAYGAAWKQHRDAQAAAFMELVRERAPGMFAGMSDEKALDLAHSMVLSAGDALSEVIAQRTGPEPQEMLAAATRARDAAGEAFSNWVMDRAESEMPQRLMPLYIRLKNPMVFDAEGRTPGDFPLTEKLELARRKKHDGVIFKNIADPSPVAVHYVSFKPERQIKGQFNAGTWSESGGLLDSIPGFYSALDREVDKASMKAAPASAWLQYLKNRPGMKPDEFEWTGVGDWLAARGNDRITKGELQDWMAANSKDINEVVTGAHLPFRLPTGVSITFEGDDDIDGPWLLSIERVNQMGGYGSSARYHSEEAAYQAARAHLEGVGALEEAQYEKYTLPGGKEYTELLITLDQKSQPITRRMIEDAAREYVQQQFDERGDRFADNQQVVDAIKDDPFAWTELWEEAVAKKLNLPFKSRMFRYVGDGPNGIMLDDPHNFKSGHFETPNVVAHLRFKSRLDADNRRVMFIEEIQSDWGQRGKREGFAQERVPQYRVTDRTGATVRGEFDTEAEARAFMAANPQTGDMLLKLPRTAGQVVTRGVPSAPFVTKTDSWTALALKRAILWAIENDFDAVAWTTGEQQAERYDLSKQVDAIRWAVTAGGKYTITASKGGNELVRKNNLSRDGVVEMIGKDMSQKVFDGVGAAAMEGTVDEKVWGKGKVGLLQGLDLSLGGEGMIGFYNNIVPKVAKDVLRKVKGPAVETLRFNDGRLRITPIPNRDAPWIPGNGTIYQVTGGDTIADVFQSREDAEAFVARHTAQLAREVVADQQGFVIPEEWKRNPIEVPLFSEAPLASEEFDYYDEKPSLEGLEAASITDLIATVRSDLSRLPEMPDRAVERLGRDWMEIGKRDELYSYRGSRDTDMENVAYDMSGRRVRVFKENPTELDVNLLGDLDVGGEPFIPVEKYRLDLQLTREQQLEVGHKTVPAFVYVDEIGHVAMNIQAFQRGVTNGNLIYQIVGTWAYNNELVFIGDPAGLSEAAIFRRAENMFVNALRTGSTRHLFPHPYQVAAGLEWRDGNDQFNIGSLALFNKRVLDLYRNELTRTGKASKNPDAMLATEAIPAGRRTAARAAMTTELLDRIENDLPGMQGGAPMPQLPVEKPLYSIDVTYEDIRNTVSDMMRSEKSVNFWDKTVGTQLAKARRFPAFGRVYNAVQKFMNDTSLLANAAAEKAPEILRQMDHWGDIIPAIRDAINPQSRKDRAVASTLLLDGRVHDRVWSKEDAMKRGATERQYHLYRQMRNAINVSLDQLATSDLYRITRDMGLDDARAKIMGLTTDKAAKLLLDAIDALPNFNEKQQQALEFVRNEINEKARRIQHLKATGYAPLMRFGRYTIEYEVDGERAFNMFETEGDRNKFERELQKSGAKIRRTGMLSTEAHKLYKGFDPAALEVFGQMTTLEFFDEQGNVRKASISETEMFQQFLRQATANHSALRRLIKAKKVPGYSEDGSRILASFVTSNARMASRNLNMQEMVKAASVADGPDKRDGDIKDEAIKLVKYVQDGQEEAQALRGLMFVNYLGGSVASALVNMSQPIMMSWPTLSRWGAGKAAAALSRGFKQAVSRRAPGGRLGADLQLAQEQGIVSPQEIHHLQAEASRTLGSNPILRAGLMAWGSLFSAAEQFNRRATFIAAWEIGNDLGMSELSKLGYDSAYQFAVDQVIETQGTYNRGNRPNWARGAVGATVFTFKQYSIHYLEWLTRLPKWQRAQALAILVFVSGVQGLPFADDLDDLIDALAQNMGYVWSTKDAKRQFLSSIVGKDLANFVMSGASTLPGVPLDVQGRLSMGSLLPGSGMLKPGATMREALEILGPVGGMIDSYTKGAKSILSGDALEAAIGFSPLAVKNLLKGADMIQTGAYRDMQGRKVVDATFMDAVVKTIGFMPPEAAEAGRRERSVQELVNLTRTGQTNIQRKWAEGIFTGDQGLVAEARDDLRKWNERNPGATIRLDMKAIQRRVAEMRKTRAERMRGNAPRSARDIVKNRLED